MVQLRVRARAVDMLGRQQIAGIPTAIHELFKNAHDAYAERVEVDYFRRKKVLVLRDDGYGMTKEDVEDRWLTLGTESRLGSNRPESVKNWTGPKSLPRRTIMGEKGIGRLAIAVIAPITLLITRAARPDGLHNPVMALVHWGLFEQPGLDIGSIDVPVEELDFAKIPNRADLLPFIERVKKNIEDLSEDIEEDEVERLLADLERFKRISPEQIDQTLQKFTRKGEEPLSLQGDGCGTHFIMLPTAEELDDDIDGGADKEASNLEKNLLGFSNTMRGQTPVIRTRFRNHQLYDEPEELIGARNFFLPEDFDKSDHHIVGQVDEFGQFKGRLRIYNETKTFVCNWVEGKGREIKCGPFSLDFAYVMGNPYESILPNDEHKIMSSKLDRIGGLYIFRDDIRILPYGNSDFDFLDIEKRRTKSAQDWFFSYRRMFGSIAIDHANNGQLHEKAGREGFRQNQAYRDFRAVLINLLQRLAMEFFRPSSPQADVYWDKKKALKAEDELLKKQKKKADDRRAEFKTQLETFFQAYEAEQFKDTAEAIENHAQRRLDRLLTLEDDGQLAIGVRDLEKQIHDKISELVKRITITKPRGLALKKSMEKDWAAYQRISEELFGTLITELRMSVDVMIHEGTADRISDQQRREAALNRLEAQRDSFVSEISSLRKAAYDASRIMQATLKEVVREEFSNFRDAIETQLTDFTKITAKQPSQLEDALASVEEKLAGLRQKEGELLEAIQRQMEDISEALTDRETINDQIGALEQRAERLEEQLEFYSEFAQLGMGVGILQHEFETTAQNMRLAVDELKPWAAGTPELRVVFKRLRNSFDHLDGYLKMLDPLGRRIRRNKVPITGSEIRGYLRRIFDRTFEEEDIKLRVTKGFVATEIKCKTSVLLGAFVNIVDNAIYWVSNGAHDEKWIRLSVDEEGFLIENSGPGIEERFSERIFDFGETTKPGGRGMGLAIAKDALEKEGFGLELIQCGSNVNPIFRINIARDEEGGDDNAE